MPSNYQELQLQIALLEDEKRKAAEQERIRQAVESANQRKIAETDQQLATLRRQAAEQGLQASLEQARHAAGINRAAVDALQAELAELIDLILERLTAPLQAAEYAYANTTAANDAALQDGITISQHAPPPPVYQPGAAPVNADEEYHRRTLIEGYGKARAGLPAPYAPDQAALIGMSRETDPQRRRAWAALHYLITGGQLVSADGRYDANQDASRREKARTQPRRF